MVLIEELKTWDLVDAKFRDGENEDEVLLDHLKPESGPRASANVVVSLRYHSNLLFSLEM